MQRIKAVVLPLAGILVVVASKALEKGLTNVAEIEWGSLDLIVALLGGAILWAADKPADTWRRVRKTDAEE